MPTPSHPASEERGRLVRIEVAAVLVPLGLVAFLRGATGADVLWESHTAHFWLVLTAALVTLGLGYAVSATAQQRRDARLFLISLAFIASFGFLALHALATPDVLLGKNAGFELATPVGLVVRRRVRRGLRGGAAARTRGGRDAPLRTFEGGLLLLLVAWGAISLSETWPLDGPLGGEQLTGGRCSSAAIGVALFAAAGAGYFRLYLRRREPFVLAVTFAFVLLAESMVVIAWARNWHVSWWEWHGLMLLAFIVILLGVRHEWHEERFSALYLDQTLAGARDVSILFADLAGLHRLLGRDGTRARRADAERVLRHDHPADGGLRRRGAPGGRRRADGDLQQGGRPA